MFILKLALITCAFYLAVAILMEAVLLVLAKVLGGLGVFMPRLGWIVIFGSVWLASFLLAWRIVMRSLTARMPK